MNAPTADLERVAASHRRLLATVDGLTGGVARRPTHLAGWTVGHLLTHLARNADSHVHRARAAVEGEVVDQYPGGRAARAWAAVPDDAWDAVSRDVSGREVPLHRLPASRWREVEVHLVDLDLGYRHLDWSDEFVDVWLDRVRAATATGEPRDGDGDAGPRFDRAADELAWRYGRLRRPDLPEPPPGSALGRNLSVRPNVRTIGG